MSSAPPTRSVSFKPALRTTFSLSVEPHHTVANRSMSSESSQPSSYSTSIRGRRQHLRILGERASLGEPSSPNSSMASSPNTATTSTMQTQQSLFSYSSPSRVRSMHGQNFSVDSATYREMLERRKSFRCRGSLGPTVASAPSVEQEDYRTPRPSVSSIKNGKSFDFGGAHAGHSSLAYETNGLVKVSADFLRLNGSRQQFRNLLSARKKLGQMPPAYTRIDYSHDSIESNPTRVQHGPVITVEDTGSQINFSFNKGSLGSPVPAPESRHSSLDRTAFLENGNCNTLTVTQPPKSNFIRNNSRRHLAHSLWIRRPD
uniref:Expressed conserved protein n=1 Tax=Panagrellus redivivus TaxID=6233 RepID=A0A7E4UVP6_PANRE